MEEASSSDVNGCGCCTADPKSVDDRVRELLERRQTLERRLSELVAAR